MANPTDSVAGRDENAASHYVSVSFRSAVIGSERYFAAWLATPDL